MNCRMCVTDSANMLCVSFCHRLRLVTRGRRYSHRLRLYSLCVYQWTLSVIPVFEAFHQPFAVHSGRVAQRAAGIDPKSVGIAAGGKARE